MNRPAVFAEALALSEKQRLELAAELLASAEPPSGVLVEGTPAFRAELARRVAEVKSGKARLIPWETLKADLLREIEQPPPRRARQPKTRTRPSR